MPYVPGLIFRIILNLWEITIDNNFSSGMAGGKSFNEISLQISRTLDSIGYSDEMVKYRRESWQEHTRIHHEIGGTRLFCSVIAGSKAEGTTCYFENDIDHLFLPADIICTNNIEPFFTLPRTKLFFTEDINTPPGYTKLKFIKGQASIDKVFDESFFKQDSEIYTSSSLFAACWNRFFRTQSHPNSSFEELTGPATPLIHQHCNKDGVIGLHCMYNEILHPFRTRPRQHDWPPESIIQDESSTLCQLVPVGCKGSCTQLMEWRFCFIETELSLTRSFNDIQMKVYIILKFIAKDILKIVTNEISSFVMKNITFWMSEFLGIQVFQEENLICLILTGLKFLKRSLKSCFLPYFMIPERNLLSERLDLQTRRDVSDLILQLLQEGPQFLFRCKKLRNNLTFMQESPLTLERYRVTRNLLERLLMLWDKVKLRKRHGCYVGLTENELLQRMYNIVLPEWKFLQSRGIDIRSKFYESLYQYLS